MSKTSERLKMTELLRQKTAETTEQKITATYQDYEKNITDLLVKSENTITNAIQEQKQDLLIKIEALTQGLDAHVAVATKSISEKVKPLHQQISESTDNLIQLVKQAQDKALQNHKSTTQAQIDEFTTQQRQVLYTQQAKHQDLMQQINANATTLTQSMEQAQDRAKQIYMSTAQAYINNLTNLHQELTQQIANQQQKTNHLINEATKWQEMIWGSRKLGKVFLIYMLIVMMVMPAMTSMVYMVEKVVSILETTETYTIGKNIKQEQERRAMLQKIKK